jgi:hypothetical protein
MLSFLQNDAVSDTTEDWLCTNADLIKNKNTFPLQFEWKEDDPNYS